jgi:hypothetical protein
MFTCMLEPNPCFILVVAFCPCSLGLWKHMLFCFPPMAPLARCWPTSPPFLRFTWHCLCTSCFRTTSCQLPLPRLPLLHHGQPGVGHPACLQLPGRCSHFPSCPPGGTCLLLHSLLLSLAASSYSASVPFLGYKLAQLLVLLAQQAMQWC